MAPDAAAVPVAAPVLLVPSLTPVNPENSSTVTNHSVFVGFVTTIVLPLTSAVMLCADRTVIQSLPAPSDRKSTRLNSSHLVISYAVFCLKKKKKQEVYILS